MNQPLSVFSSVRFSSLIHLSLYPWLISFSPCFTFLPEKRAEKGGAAGITIRQSTPDPSTFLTLLHLITCVLSLSVYPTLANLLFSTLYHPLLPPLMPFVAFIWLLASPSLMCFLALLEVSPQQYIKRLPYTTDWEQWRCILSYGSLWHQALSSPGTYCIANRIWSIYLN